MSARRAKAEGPERLTPQEALIILGDLTQEEIDEVLVPELRKLGYTVRPPVLSEGTNAVE